MMLSIGRRERTDERTQHAEQHHPFNLQKETVMKSVLKVAVLTSLLASFSAFAHHPAADIVDEDIYEMIDDNVVDTPHADLDFSSMGR